MVVAPELVLPAPAAAQSADELILDAALAEILEYGLRRTSVSDVARRAGVSRVTVHRRLGSKTDLVRAVLLREAARFLAELQSLTDASASLEDRLVEGFSTGVQCAREHPLIGRLLVSEPDVVLPLLTVDAGPVLAVVRAFLADQYVRSFPEAPPSRQEAELAAELLARLAISLVLTPDGAIRLDRSAARALVRTHILPMVARS